MITKIVHRTRDCVGIIAGVQHIDGPLQVKHWGVRTLRPCGVDAYGGQCLWCCYHHSRAIANVHPVHVMNVEQRTSGL